MPQLFITNMRARRRPLPIDDVLSELPAGAVEAMAQRIQALTLLAHEQDRRIAALHDELSRSGAGTVVPLGRGDAV